MKFSPTFTIAETTVALRQSFSWRLTIRTQFVNSDAYMANKVATLRTFNAASPAIYCSPPAIKIIESLIKNIPTTIGSNTIFNAEKIRFKNVLYSSGLFFMIYAILGTETTITALISCFNRL